jgi:xanthine dehydrogenase YagS FAD-binding subunit
MRSLMKFEHVNAKTINEAVAVLAAGKAAVVAGGTDLVGTMRFGILRDDMYPQTLVNLKTITPSLDYIREEGSVLKIGALTRLEDIARNSIIRTKYTALSEAAQRTGSPHIREMGTIGGNICQFTRCWYFRKEDNRFDCLRKGGRMCFARAGDNRYHSIFGNVLGCVAVNPSDTAPALVALDAKIVTSKRTIDAEKFWAVKIPSSTVLDPDEIVTQIQIPVPPAGVKSAFVKFALRTSIDFPIVNCAAAIGSGHARICLNAVHNLPYRATKAEDSIRGKTIDVAGAEAAATAGVQEATPLPYRPAVQSVGVASPAPPYGNWKIQVAKTMVKRAILQCV